MANFVAGFKDFVAKPEGKAALAAAAAFVGYSWWKNHGANASAAVATPAPASDATTPGVTMPSYVYGPSTSSGDGLHDGSGVATTPVTGTTGGSTGSSSSSASGTPIGGVVGGVVGGASS
ncbi:MAG: hypothetical protein ACRD72_22340, partial [Candidatus Angelobacter sp.]